MRIETWINHPNGSRQAQRNKFRHFEKLTYVISKHSSTQADRNLSSYVTSKHRLIKLVNLMATNFAEWYSSLSEFHFGNSDSCSSPRSVMVVVAWCPSRKQIHKHYHGIILTMIKQLVFYVSKDQSMLLGTIRSCLGRLDGPITSSLHLLP